MPARLIPLVAGGILNTAGAWAVAAPAPADGVVNFSSSATVEVRRDLMSITFSTARDGADAATVQSQLKQALDAALAEARRSARPGEVEVHTGNFSLAPRYLPKGGINGWQGSAELVVEGSDIAALGQLSGRITTLTIARVGYAVSRPLRDTSEAAASAQAIAGYRAKAADYARDFGYAGYTIREVNISSNDVSTPRPMAMFARSAAAAASDEALPAEPGKSSVTVTVQGTVQLTR